MITANSTRPPIQVAQSRHKLSLRQASFPRAGLLAAASLLLTFLLAGHSYTQPSPLLFLPILVCLAAVYETVRSMNVRWDLHHMGAVLLLYAEVMLFTMLAFLGLYPYFA